MKILIFFLLMLLSPFTAAAQDIEPTPTPRLLPSPDFPKEDRPLIASQADGQTTSLSGTVTFRGEVLPSVEVTLINSNTGKRRTVMTNDVGEFTVHGLVPGSYEVRVSKAGFAISRQDIELLPGQTSSLNVSMDLGVTGEIPVGTASGSGEATHGSSKAAGAEVPVVPPSPSQTTSTADFVSKNFDNDIELLTWLNTKKTERKLLVRIITIRDKTSLFMFQTVKNALAYQYTVSLVNEVLDENKLLVRINQNKGKTFIGMHPLTSQSYLMVFYGK